MTNGPALSWTALSKTCKHDLTITRLVREHVSDSAARRVREYSDDGNGTEHHVIVYRRAQPADATSISGVLLAAFAPYECQYTHQGFAATAIQPNEVEQRIRDGPVWVAEADGEIVGTVSAVLRGRALYIRGMAVLPSAQGRGIGDRLLKEAEQFGAESGVTDLELSTTPFLCSARALYERHGFQYAGGDSSLHGTALLTMRKSSAARTRS